MRRIGLAVVLALGLLVPLAAEAEQAKGPRIGVMAPGSPPPESSQSISAFVQGLRDLGWVPGQNITLEYRWTGDSEDRYPEIVRDLVRLRVDLIVAGTGRAAPAAKQATRSIPIVMASVPFPVESGLIASLARPGGNVTGIATLTYEVIGKRLELLKLAAPRASLIAILQNGSVSDRIRKGIEDAARSAGVRVDIRGVQDAGELERTFRALQSESAQAFTHLPSPFFRIHARKIADLALKHRLPGIYGDAGGFVESGGLMFYGDSIPDNWRRSARYVDSILKGAKPADLPVEQPTKFDLIINLKTAKTLGLTIPQTLLLQATHVIE